MKGRSFFFARDCDVVGQELCGAGRRRARRRHVVRAAPQARRRRPAQPPLPVRLARRRERCGPGARSLASLGRCAPILLCSAAAPALAPRRPASTRRSTALLLRQSASARLAAAASARSTALLQQQRASARLSSSGMKPLSPCPGLESPDACMTRRSDAGSKGARHRQALAANPAHVQLCDRQPSYGAPSCKVRCGEAEGQPRQVGGGEEGVGGRLVAARREWEAVRSRRGGRQTWRSLPAPACMRAQAQALVGGEHRSTAAPQHRSTAAPQHRSTAAWLSAQEAVAA